MSWSVSLPLNTCTRLLAKIKWLQAERDAWEREAEMHEETIAARDAELARARELYSYTYTLFDSWTGNYLPANMERYDTAIAAVKVASDES